MFKSPKTRAIVLVPLVVFAIMAAFSALGYLMIIIMGIPFSLACPLPVRLLGLFLVASGFIFFGWLFRNRKPFDIIISTYVTFLKAAGRTRLEELSGRTESLVVTGPYRYVRHPLYFGVVVLVLGWGLLLDFSFLLLSAVFLLLWFNFAVAPFEEKELTAIFGEQYKRYAEEVPRMVPFAKRHKTIKPTENKRVEAASDFPRPNSFLSDMIRGGQDRSSKAVRLLRFVNRFVAPLYLMYVLPLLGFGRIFLVLTTKGRKTGKNRRTPLEYHKINNIIHLLSSRGEKADWIRNIKAYPDNVWAQAGFRKFRARAEIIKDISEIECFMRWYSRNHPNLARAFYGWDPKRDDPDTADFSSFAKHLTLVRVYSWG